MLLDRWFETVPAPGPARAAAVSGAAAAATVAAIAVLGGCDGPAAPRPAGGTESSPGPGSAEVAGTWDEALWRLLAPDDGATGWAWSAATDSGRAELVVAGAEYRWRLTPPPPAGRLRLVPDGERWLPMAVGRWDALADAPPLPRIAVASTAYPDLVSMLRELLQPRFAGRVPHWAARPVPVGAPPAVSGEVDLRACLREAVENWNAGAPEPWFVWDPQASWGVHLAHYAGSLRSPPLQAQVLREDAEGRILHVRISVGDDYATASARRHAVRGLAHELGHALLLWGHSPDRIHLLWGDAPPLRADPSSDERLAVRLRQLLPHGLDLAVYRE
jgi:hypothetical protein